MPANAERRFPRTPSSALPRASARCQGKRSDAPCRRSLDVRPARVVRSRRAARQTRNSGSARRACPPRPRSTAAADQAARTAVPRRSSPTVPGDKPPRPSRLRPQLPRHLQQARLRLNRRQVIQIDRTFLPAFVQSLSLSERNPGRRMPGSSERASPRKNTASRGMLFDVQPQSARAAKTTQQPSRDRSAKRSVVIKSLSENRRGLSQFCAVLGAKWDCPLLRGGFRIGSKQRADIVSLAGERRAVQSNHTTWDPPVAAGPASALPSQQAPRVGLPYDRYSLRSFAVRRAGDYFTTRIRSTRGSCSTISASTKFPPSDRTW